MHMTIRIVKSCSGREILKAISPIPLFNISIIRIRTLPEKLKRKIIKMEYK